jgi:CBS domain-containing protein
MTPTPITVNDGLMLSDALDRMYANNIHHMPVVHREHGFIGTISADDIASATSARGLDPEETPVREAMRRDAYTCALISPLVDVIHQMERRHLGSVVITEGDRPVGIFTTTDALRTLRSQLVGYPVRPAVNPPVMNSTEARVAPDEPEVSSTTRHPIRPSVRVHRNHGTLPCFTATL